MLVTLLEIITEVKREQPWKAPVPILVTLLGIETLVSMVHPTKAQPPILVTPSGMIRFLISVVSSL